MFKNYRSNVLFHLEGMSLFVLILVVMLNIAQPRTVSKIHDGLLKIICDRVWVNEISNVEEVCRYLEGLGMAVVVNNAALCKVA